MNPSAYPCEYVALEAAGPGGAFADATRALVLGARARGAADAAGPLWDYDAGWFTLFDALATNLAEIEAGGDDEARVAFEFDAESLARYGCRKLGAARVRLVRVAGDDAARRDAVFSKACADWADQVGEIPRAFLAGALS